MLTATFKDMLAVTDEAARGGAAGR
jgi:hypothetical protein